MADLPPDAQSYRIAAVVPCKHCGGTGRRFGAPCDCGDGTRVVITDVEVNQRPSTPPDWWREVPRD